MNQDNISEEEYIKALGERIKSLRTLAGLTQQQLSDIVGIEESALRRIESGRTNPTVKTLFKISKAFQITVSQMLELHDPK